MLHHRREFLRNVGRGMLVAGLGHTLAADLGCSPALAAEGSKRITFGPLESLVGLMQDTPPDKLQALLIGKLKAGEVDVKQLVSAAALANARTFGGEDYVGYHAQMALLPAYQMSQEISGPLAALPVLKVIHRNSSQIQQRGGSKNEVLHALEHAAPADEATGELLRKATRATNMEEAERVFAGIARGPAQQAFQQLQVALEDEVDVHRVVLAQRSLSILALVGEEHAHTMLRQSVHFFVRSEQHRIRNNRPESPIRTLVPKLLDEHKLAGKKLGDRVPDDGWLERMMYTLYSSNPEQAAGAVAAALAEGIAPAAIGEALSLASNLLVLRDRNPRIHGDSTGVHASDATHAWRSIAGASDPRGTAASLILAGYHAASGGRSVISGNGNSQADDVWPLAADRKSVEETKDGKELLGIADEAIRTNGQGRAAAAIWQYGQLGLPERPVFDLMLKYAISEDGRLHAEKYYRTVSDEFARTRPAFRWRQLVALARVTASAYGYDRHDQKGHRAPGYEEATKMLS